VKTTVEIPDDVFRRAKARAAERGQPLREFLTEAVKEKLSGGHRAVSSHAAPWMRGFGGLRSLHRETARIQAVVDETFDVVEAEDRR
jgi:hypothetical protein